MRIKNIDRTLCTAKLGNRYRHTRNRNTVRLSQLEDSGLIDYLSQKYPGSKRVPKEYFD